MKRVYIHISPRFCQFVLLSNQTVLQCWAVSGQWVPYNWDHFWRICRNRHDVYSCVTSGMRDCNPWFLQTICQSSYTNVQWSREQKEVLYFHWYALLIHWLCLSVIVYSDETHLVVQKGRQYLVEDLLWFCADRFLCCHLFLVFAIVKWGYFCCNLHYVSLFSPSASCLHNLFH